MIFVVVRDFLKPSPEINFAPLRIFFQKHKVEGHIVADGVPGEESCEKQVLYKPALDLGCTALQDVSRNIPSNTRDVPVDSQDDYFREFAIKHEMD